MATSRTRPQGRATIENMKELLEILGLLGEDTDESTNSGDHDKRDSWNPGRRTKELIGDPTGLLTAVYALLEAKYDAKLTELGRALEADDLEKRATAAEAKLAIANARLERYDRDIAEMLYHGNFSNELLHYTLERLLCDQHEGPVTRRNPKCQCPYCQ